MKKLITIVAVLGFGIMSSFAVDATYKSISFTGSVPMIFESTSKNGVDSDTNVYGVGLGVNAMSLITEKVGLYAALDLVFPQSVEIEISSPYGSIKGEMDRSDFDSLWGFSFLFGPCFALKRTETVFLTIAPGFHYTMLTMDTEIAESTVYMYGLGANLQARFKMGEKAFFALGFDTCYDFYSVLSSSGDSETGSTSDFEFKPFIGFGFTW